MFHEKSTWYATRVQEEITTWVDSLGKTLGELESWEGGVISIEAHHFLLHYKVTFTGDEQEYTFVLRCPIYEKDHS